MKKMITIDTRQYKPLLAFIHKHNLSLSIAGKKTKAGSIYHIDFVGDATDFEHMLDYLETGKEPKTVKNPPSPERASSFTTTIKAFENATKSACKYLFWQTIIGLCLSLLYSWLWNWSFIYSFISWLIIVILWPANDSLKNWFAQRTKVLNHPDYSLQKTKKLLFNDK